MRPGAPNRIILIINIAIITCCDRDMYHSRTSYSRNFNQLVVREQTMHATWNDPGPRNKPVRIARIHTKVPRTHTRYHSVSLDHYNHHHLTLNMPPRSSSSKARPAKVCPCNLSVVSYFTNFRHIAENS